MGQTIYRERAEVSSTKTQYTQATRINLWDMPKYNKIYRSFTTIDGKQTGRNVRQEYCYRKYQPYMGDKLLDVGCGDAVMRDLHLGQYTGVDVFGSPDLFINLESEKLPFNTGEFDTTVCLEVLEHLDNPHEVLQELLRVTRRYLIISLPNCWRQFFYHFANGSTDLPEYGFPAERPMDRHKWFFGPEEAYEFVNANAQKLGYSIQGIDHIINVGGLLRTAGVDQEKRFVFPPNICPSEMSFLQRSHYRYWSFLEWILRKFLIRENKWKDDINIINTWFVIEKLAE